MRHLWILLLCGGCATFAFPGQGPGLGFVYTDASTPQTVGENSLGKKKGEACATSILGWVTTGDAGIRAAADAGGITRISAVDTTFTNVLGVWAKYCTIVSGDAGEAPPPAPAPAPDAAVPAPTEPAPAPAEPAPAPAPTPTPQPG